MRLRDHGDVDSFLTQVAEAAAHEFDQDESEQAAYLATIQKSREALDIALRCNGLTDAARTKITSAYRMCEAALGET